jgi:hypothetical protein
VQWLPTADKNLQWFLLNAESESCVVHGFKFIFYVQNVAPTVSQGNAVIQLYVVRAAGLPTCTSIDNVPSADIVSSYVVNCCAGSYGTYNVVFDKGYTWFSRRKCRLPVDHGLYVGIYQSKTGDGNAEFALYGHGWLYKRVA